MASIRSIQQKYPKRGRKCTCRTDPVSDSEEDEPRSPLSSRANSGHRDLLRVTSALHHSETLKTSNYLENVFCACYESETVMSLLQRKEGSFCEMQKLLLEKHNLARLFHLTTSLDPILNTTTTISSKEEQDSLNKDHLDQRNTDGIYGLEKYRKSFLATEIIIRFILKFINWWGGPKVDEKLNDTTMVMRKSNTGNRFLSLSHTSSTSTTTTTTTTNSAKKDLRTNTVTSPTNSSKAALTVLHPHRSKRSSFGGSSQVTASIYDVGNEEKRSYTLRLDELTESEWTLIFSQMFRFLIEQTVVDSSVVGNMSKIIKSFVCYPSVVKIFFAIRMEDPTKKSNGLMTIFDCMARHAYNPEIVSLLHGLVHIARRLEIDYKPIIDGISRALISYSPQEIYNLDTTTTTAAIQDGPVDDHHDQWAVTGLCEILTKILSKQFPNTFGYFIQGKRQLASYETIESFEKEMFPAKTIPNDRGLHEELRKSVLEALRHSGLDSEEDNDTGWLRLAELGLAQLQWVNLLAREEGVPPVLVLDVIKSSLEATLQLTHRRVPKTSLTAGKKSPTSPSRTNAIPKLGGGGSVAVGGADMEVSKFKMDMFLPSIKYLIPSLCTSVNYTQYDANLMACIATNRFSDDEDDAEEEGDGGGEGAVGKNIKRSVRVANTANTDNSPTAQVATNGSSGSGTPLYSTCLLISVIDVLNAFISISNDEVDILLTRAQLCMSLLDLFRRFEASSLLHCRVLNLLLTLIDRPYPSSSGSRCNNPLVRSLFLPKKNNLLDFLMATLSSSSVTNDEIEAEVVKAKKKYRKVHGYNVHLRILTVKLDKICSSPTLQQEVIRQFCFKQPEWKEFCASVVASHYQQLDALDEMTLGTSMISLRRLTSITQGKMGSSSGNEDDVADTDDSDSMGSSDMDEDAIVLTRCSVASLASAASSSSDFLARELQPFRRLPSNTETGVGASHNVASGKEAVHPSEMYKSRSQSAASFSNQSIVELLRQDMAVGVDAKSLKTPQLTGNVYQRHKNCWKKVFLTFEKERCLLEIDPAGGTNPKTNRYSPLSSLLPLISNGNSSSATSSPVGGGGAGGAGGTGGAGGAGAKSSGGSELPRKDSAFSLKSRLSEKFQKRWSNKWSHGDTKREGLSSPGFVVGNANSTINKKKLLVSSARPWIAFGRQLQKQSDPDFGAFGFQLDVFNQLKEEEQTLTFVTKSEKDRRLWCQLIQDSVDELRRHSTPTRSPTKAASKGFDTPTGSPNTKRSSSGPGSIVEASDPEVLKNMVKSICHAKDQPKILLALPDVKLMSPWIASTNGFYLKCLFPEQLPFWGVFHGIYGIHKYNALFGTCLEVIHMEEKQIQVQEDPILQSLVVFVDFIMSVQRTRLYNTNATSMTSVVTCHCIDTYVIDPNMQVVGITKSTKTPEEGTKLVQLLTSDE